MLSATVHSGADLIGRAMLEDVNGGSAGRVFAVKLKRQEQMNAASSAGLGYIHLLKCVGPLFRMDTAKSDETVSRLGGGVLSAHSPENVDWSA